MIHLIKNNINKVTVTLSEKVTLVDPFYIVYLEAKGSDFTVLFNLGNDNSLDKVRSNIFNIEETESVNLTEAKVELEVGSYDYVIYESTVTTLDLSTTTGIVESGLCLVSSSTDGEETIFDSIKSTGKSFE